MSARRHRYGLLLGGLILMLVLAACREPIGEAPGEAPSQPTALPQTPASTAPASVPASGFTRVAGSAGQTIYVPVYSHIYYRDKRRVFNLTATLSIRNTDAQVPLELVAVRYYNSAGEHVRDYVAAPRSLGPLASLEFVVDEEDTSGGSGANFIVEWQAGAAVTPPVVESVMISTAASTGISFVSPGRVLAERTGTGAAAE